MAHHGTVAVHTGGEVGGKCRIEICSPQVSSTSVSRIEKRFPCRVSRPLRQLKQKNSTAVTVKWI